jgi:septal ring factor EnvC (AmiA/AmiB activator)
MGWFYRIGQNIVWHVFANFNGLLILCFPSRRDTLLSSRFSCVCIIGQEQALADQKKRQAQRLKQVREQSAALSKALLEKDRTRREQLHQIADAEERVRE